MEQIKARSPFSSVNRSVGAPKRASEHSRREHLGHSNGNYRKASSKLEASNKPNNMQHLNKMIHTNSSHHKLNLKAPQTHKPNLMAPKLLLNLLLATCALLAHFRPAHCHTIGGQFVGAPPGRNQEQLLLFRLPESISSQLFAGPQQQQQHQVGAHQHRKLARAAPSEPHTVSLVPLGPSPHEQLAQQQQQLHQHQPLAHHHQARGPLPAHETLTLLHPAGPSGHQLISLTAEQAAQLLLAQPQPLHLSPAPAAPAPLELQQPVLLQPLPVHAPASPLLLEANLHHPQQQALGQAPLQPALWRDTAEAQLAPLPAQPLPPPAPVGSGPFLQPLPLAQPQPQPLPQPLQPVLLPQAQLQLALHQPAHNQSSQLVSSAASELSALLAKLSTSSPELLHRLRALLRRAASNSPAPLQHPESPAKGDHVLSVSPTYEQNNNNSLAWARLNGLNSLTELSPLSAPTNQSRAQAEAASAAEVAAANAAEQQQQVAQQSSLQQEGGASAHTVSAGSTGNMLNTFLNSQNVSSHEEIKVPLIVIAMPRILSLKRNQIGSGSAEQAANASLPSSLSSAFAQRLLAGRHLSAANANQLQNSLGAAGANVEQLAGLQTDSGNNSNNATAAHNYNQGQAGNNNNSSATSAIGDALSSLLARAHQQHNQAAQGPSSNSQHTMAPYARQFAAHQQSSPIEQLYSSGGSGGLARHHSSNATSGLAPVALSSAQPQPQPQLQLQLQLQPQSQPQLLHLLSPQLANLSAGPHEQLLAGLSTAQTRPAGLAEQLIQQRIHEQQQQQQLLDLQQQQPQQLLLLSPIGAQRRQLDPSSNSDALQLAGNQGERGANELGEKLALFGQQINRLRPFLLQQQQQQLQKQQQQQQMLQQLQAAGNSLRQDPSQQAGNNSTDLQLEASESHATSSSSSSSSAQPQAKSPKMFLMLL